MSDRAYDDANRRAAWRWGSLVVGLLSLQVIGGIFAIVLATGDESVAIVPDYHQKAIHWDDEMALQRSSTELGWVCAVKQIDESDREAGLRLTLTDRKGEMIDVVKGELRIYRHVRAADLRVIPIPPGPLPTLQLSRCFDADGWWQVMIDVTDREGNRFANSTKLDVRIKPEAKVPNGADANVSGTHVSGAP